MKLFWPILFYAVHSATIVREGEISNDPEFVETDCESQLAAFTENYRQRILISLDDPCDADHPSYDHGL